MSIANVCRAKFAWLGLLLPLIWSSLLALPKVHAQSSSFRFQPYTCLTRYVDLSKWMEAGRRELDDRGILLQDKEYHPLSIAFYGILLYDAYQTTGDTSLLPPLRNQFQYFLDSTLVDISEDGNAMGLPYRFKFKDLKSPWYSGMTQGVALSYLLRYFELSHDMRARNVARQVVNFMLKPESEGGTMGHTPEGFDWIEEYPNSLISPQVLNGFINGLIGLREYCFAFPEDDLAKRIHDNCYDALLATMSAYDRCLATSYDRKMVRFCSEGYLFYEGCEMEQLYAMYGEPQFLRQMQLWAWMGEFKPDMENAFYRKPGYVLGRSMEEDDETKSYHTGLAFETGLGELSSYVLECGSQRYVVNKDKRLPVGVVCNSSSKFGELSIVPQQAGHYFKLNFDQDLETLGLELLALNKAGDRFAPLVLQRARSMVVMDTQAIHSLLLRIPGKAKVELRPPSIWCLDPENLEIPRYLHKVMPGHLYLEAGKAYEVSAWSDNIADMQIFYRWGVSPMRCDESSWRASQVLKNGGKFVVPEKGYYSFLVSFAFAMPDPKLGNIAVLPAD